MKMGAARYGPSMANRRAVLWAVFGWGLLWAGAAARTTTGGHQIPESAVKTKEEFMSFTFLMNGSTGISRLSSAAPLSDRF